MIKILTSTTKKHNLKISALWILFILGLATVIWAVFVGHPLFPSYKIIDLSHYPVWQIPILYTVSYITRAWGPLLFAFMLGGIIVGFVPRDKFHRMMASNKLSSYFIAASIAPILTVCSCAMLPIFGALLVSGAGIGPAVTFLLMAPAANILAFVITGADISWKLALSRVIVSYIGSVIIGYFIGRTTYGKAVEKEYAGMQALDIEEHFGRAFTKKSMIAFDEGVSLARKILPVLLGGVAVISFIEAYLPTELVVEYLNGVRGICISSIIGVPMYTPSLVEVALVKAMLIKGMAPAAGLAFMIGGPMCSIPSMLSAARIAGWKVVVTYAILAVFLGIFGGLFYLKLIITL